MQKSISLPPKSRFTLSNLQNLLAFHKNPLFFYENVTKLFSSERCKSSFYSFLRSRVLVAPSGYMLRIIGIYFLTQCSPYSHCQSSVHGAPSFRYSSRPRCFAAAWWFRLRGRELRPEDACQKRFSWFSDWSPKVQKCVKTHKCKSCRSRQELSDGQRSGARTSQKGLFWRSGDTENEEGKGSAQGKVKPE